ncbi:MAG: hypothetical protein LBQ83_02315 [Candidatus Margulisbacteria bacterium]|jgi:hypothetical protein|nr:hypothetical protein [Candidatus Margulisiibacteriota bacterium]
MQDDKEKAHFSYDVFMAQELTRPSFLQKLFNIQPKNNALVEINNLFATKKLLDISLDDICEIATRYEVNINKAFKKQLLEFYRTYLEYCLRDKHLSDTELKELSHLKKILNLTDSTTKDTYNELTAKIYKSAVKDALADNRLSKEEKSMLEKIEKNLALPEEIAKKIYEESATAIVQKFFDNAVSDRKLSPDEEKEIEAISKNLGVNIIHDSATQETLDKYRLFWQIENGNLPIVKVDIALQRNEQCHFSVDAEWHEQRTVTQRINYSGVVMRAKIMKGVYYKIGSVSPQRVTEDVWRNIDSGKIYLTNKRIVFMGGRGNKTIPFKKILDFDVYSDGIQIQKDTGKSPLIQFSNNTGDICGAILGKLIIENT